MTNSLATVALVLVLAGSAVAQQKPSKRTTSDNKSSGGTISANDAARSNPSAANTHDGTNGSSTGGGTGLTLEQNQASSSNTGNRPTSVDPASSVRTSAPATKARKKVPKSGN